MDFYGIGAALHGAFEILMRASRATGRTTHMIESVKEGDRICFARAQEAERVRRLLQSRGIKGVECIVVNPRTPHDLMGRGTAQGRLIFDHGWVEEFYSRALEQATAEVGQLQRMCSGYGEAHEKTKHQAMDIARWRL